MLLHAQDNFFFFSHEHMVWAHLRTTILLFFLKIGIGFVILCLILMSVFVSDLVWSPNVSPNLKSYLWLTWYPELKMKWTQILSFKQYLQK